MTNGVHSRLNVLNPSLISIRLLIDETRRVRMLVDVIARRDDKSCRLKKFLIRGTHPALVTGSFRRRDKGGTQINHDVSAVRERERTGTERNIYEIDLAIFSSLTSLSPGKIAGGFAFI
jgi:hypothetical protein